MTVDCEGDAEILLGQKKELLAELEVERRVMRRKLFASSEINILEDNGEGVGSWKLNGGEAESEVPVVRLGPVGSRPDVAISS